MAQGILQVLQEGEVKASRTEPLISVPSQSFLFLRVQLPTAANWVWCTKGCASSMSFRAFMQQGLNIWRCS